MSQQSDWRIDHTAGRPILVYKNCSVIEAEQAAYVLRLIELSKSTEPIATLHDDGYWTRKGQGVPYESNSAGWRMDVYATQEASTRAIRKAALEEAAKICEMYEAKIANSSKDNRAQHFMGAMIGASACADAIRTLMVKDDGCVP